MEVIQDKEQLKKIKNHMTAGNTKGMGPALSHMGAEAMGTNLMTRLMLSATIGDQGCNTAHHIRTGQHAEPGLVLSNLSQNRYLRNPIIQANIMESKRGQRNTNKISVRRIMTTPVLGQVEEDSAYMSKQRCRRIHLPFLQIWVHQHRVERLVSSGTLVQPVAESS